MTTYFCSQTYTAFLELQTASWHPPTTWTIEFRQQILRDDLHGPGLLLTNALLFGVTFPARDLSDTLQSVILQFALSLKQAPHLLSLLLCRMVSIFQAAIATVFAVAALSSHANAQGVVAPALAVGEYFRLSGSQVSEFPDATTPYCRSPCPMLNTLANHGYLPRNGQSVTRQMIKDVMVNVFKVSVGAADFLVNQVPEIVTLDYLSTHNFIEYNASLAHYDSYLSKDPSFVDPVLPADFLGRANSQGRIDVDEGVIVRKERKQVCEKINPLCNLGAKLDALAFAESSFLLLAMGGDQGESISMAHAESLLLFKKILADYKKPATDVSSLDILATTSKLKVLSVF